MRIIKHLLLVLISFYLVILPSYAYLPITNNGQPVTSLAPMLKRAMPGVVNVVVRGEMPAAPRAEKAPVNPQQRKQLKPGMEPFQSVGSGVIIDAKKGYVITNAHVVKYAKEITVNLNDGRSFKAKKIGTDPDSDIAVLQIKAKKLIALPLGDSSKLQIGDVVVAIGNPFGLNVHGPTSTATAGIISALQRSDLGIENYENFIQTDASINPGNSGGALVNLKGELVGINTAILAPGGRGGSVGIGFAIPVNMAKNIMNQLVKYGSVRRGLMGILVQSFTPKLAEAFGTPNLKGALVSKVSKGSPAEGAGLTEGDVIIKMNKQVIRSGSDVRNLVGLLRVGDKVSLEVMRGKKKVPLQMKIVDPKQHRKQQYAAQRFLFGMALKEFDAQSPSHGEVHGVQITGLTATSPGWQAGLRPGDVITSVNQKKVQKVSSLETVAKAAKDNLLVHVLRGSAALYFVVTKN